MDSQTFMHSESRVLEEKWYIGNYTHHRIPSLMTSAAECAVMGRAWLKVGLWVSNLKESMSLHGFSLFSLLPSCYGLRILPLPGSFTRLFSPQNQLYIQRPKLLRIINTNKPFFLSYRYWILSFHSMRRYTSL